MSVKTILFDISNHGFGHLSQTAPVIERLQQCFPNVRMFVRTKHPRSIVKEFISSDIQLGDAPAEATMDAPDAMSVDLEASAAAYAQLYARWDEVLNAEQQFMQALRPSAVVSNINPLSLAAARRAGVPNIALCCMNWMDIYKSYFGCRPEARHIEQTMHRAYSEVEAFLQPRPHMNMSDLPRRRSIGPIARKGVRRIEELRKRLKLGEGEKLALLTLGGLPNPESLDLPRVSGLRWLMRRAIAPLRDDVSTSEAAGLSMLDLLFSVDAVICKDSYCTVVEAACASVGIVMAPRENWPETDCLVEWAAEHCNFALAPNGLKDAQGLGVALEDVLQGRPKAAIEATGVDEAVSAIATAASL
ncbi:hypothetical protein OGR47_15695 [Methylocystis sp. MJC1]|jgi:hypothetical protein|uniref:hypothetical protein n=1 Tax=Methylocystis sp. MJC1 TaxID=2654282 RepID=UPI0013EB431C|nr:hypothetical protein [Methylocystis sp. MJC1]KAF2988872.1 hypothetical protein MJC1_04059 [Methylocystis sp. MJC1]MBU6528401.1 hypothetical protein [Methylocystis sp. MJC1]UZX11302.1 hypothetical protein OGR47_15695 [Methylocystis sp. MJC1]